MTKPKDPPDMKRMGYSPSVFSSSDLTYNDYLKVKELIALQIPQSSPAHHDELLFIIIHQAYELWFKLIIHEIDWAIQFLAKGEVLRARQVVHRSVEIFRVLVEQIHVLETLDPVEFLQFRDRLNPASGFQSLQFREIEFMAGAKEEKYLSFFENRPEFRAALQKRLEGPDLRQTFNVLLASLNLGADPLLAIYQYPERNLPLYLLCESLVDLDQQMSLWREHHVRVVERLIGFKRGTGGSGGVEYLKSTVGKKAFPEIWDVRTRLEKRAEGDPLGP